jgi:hypothetical protein
MAPQVIMTCFAGRRRYLEILVKYVDKLIAKGLVDEFHMWDYTRDPEDAVWIRENCQRFKIFEVKDKYGMTGFNWDEYYNYYPKQNLDPRTVLIKCDDDIVFIDVDKFQSFIDKRRDNPENFIAFPSIVNNKLPTAIQRECGVWPDLTHDEIEDLYTSKDICSKLHKYFVKNIDEFISKLSTRGKFTTPPCRDSCVQINFMAILGADIDKFLQVDSRSGDEPMLSWMIPKFIGRKNYVDGSFVVSHMASCDQRKAGYDETEDLKAYLDLAIARLDNVVNH